MKSEQETESLELGPLFFFEHSDVKLSGVWAENSPRKNEDYFL